MADEQVDSDRLPIPPDSVTVALLHRAVAYNEHARSHAALHSDVDRMVAIHGFDNAVEYLLRIVSDHLDIEARAGKNFDSAELAALAGEVDRFLRNEYGTALPYLNDIKRLRQVRNLVQHGAVDPGNELGRFERCVGRFFDRVFTEVFGIAPSAMLLSAAVADEEVRGHLEAAERHMEDKEWVDAVACARNAFESARFKASDRSRVVWNELPARLETMETAPSTGWFFRGIRDEILLLRLGIAAHRFDRFRDYVRHLPGEFQLDSLGSIIMQREWTEDDAAFCYAFAAEAALRWESMLLQPLYEPRTRHSYEFSHVLGGLDIPVGAQAMTYTGEMGEPEIEVFIVGHHVKESLGELPEGSRHVFETRVMVDGKLETDISREIVLLARSMEILTHSPPRWQVALRIQRVPFTWHRKDYSDGAVASESLAINSASAAALQEELYGVTAEMAEAIVAWRERTGSISSIDDLRQITGLSEAAINWICYFTRIP